MSVEHIGDIWVKQQLKVGHVYYDCWLKRIS